MNAYRHLETEIIIDANDIHDLDYFFQNVETTDEQLEDGYYCDVIARYLEPRNNGYYEAPTGDSFDLVTIYSPELDKDITEFISNITIERVLDDMRKQVE